MPLVQIKTMSGSSKKAIKKTMHDVNQIVAQNLGYDSAHVWVFVEEIEHDHFLTAGKTWEELKPIIEAGQKEK